MGIIEKDYAPEWLLYGIYHKNSKIKDLMILKGGTSIRKVYYPRSWRYSDDLDFTLPPHTNPENIISGLDEICDILKVENNMNYKN